MNEFAYVLERSDIRLIRPGDVRLWLRGRYQTQTGLCSRVPEIMGDLRAERLPDPRHPVEVRVLVLRAAVAIANSGAIWVPEPEPVLLPYYQNRLVLLLDPACVVANRATGEAKAAVHPLGGTWIHPSGHADAPGKTSTIQAVDLSEVLVILEE